MENYITLLVSDFFNEKGELKNFMSNTGCPIATAIKRQFNAVSVNELISYAVIYLRAGEKVTIIHEKYGYEQYKKDVELMSEIESDLVRHIEMKII